jgi:putative transcriptional regulator
MSRAGNRILQSVRLARAYARGEATEGFAVQLPENVDVKAIRRKSGLSQEAFASRYGFSPAAVRDWEQHRRQPEQAARVLLLVIAHNPEAVTDALAAARRSVASRNPTDAGPAGLVAAVADDLRKGAAP